MVTARIAPASSQTRLPKFNAQTCFTASDVIRQPHCPNAASLVLLFNRSASPGGPPRPEAAAHTLARRNVVAKVRQRHGREHAVDRQIERAQHGAVLPVASDQHHADRKPCRHPCRNRRGRMANNVKTGRCWKSFRVPEQRSPRGSRPGSSAAFEGNVGMSRGSTPLSASS